MNNNCATNVYIITRLRIQKKECYHGSANSEAFENQRSHHNTGHSEFTESEDLSNYVQEQQTQEDDKNITPQDLTNFPLEQATQEEVDKNEKIELDEYDGPKKVEESNHCLKEILATGYFNSMSIIVDKMLLSLIAAEEGSRPIPVSEFCAHVEKLCANRDELFTK